MAVDRTNWPVMVKLGLWGLPTRGSAWAFVWLSLVVAAVGLAVGFVFPLAFVGTLTVFAALWYYLSIRWVDANGRWS